MHLEYSELNKHINLKSVVVPFSLVLVVLETHEADGQETQRQDDAADEAWSIEPVKVFNK